MKKQPSLPQDTSQSIFPDVDADIAVALNLLEYAHDPADYMKAFVRWPRLILSYSPTDIDAACDRLTQGWCNNLTMASVVNLANEAGFSLVGLLPCPPSHRIFDFVLTR